MSGPRILGLNAFHGDAAAAALAGGQLVTAVEEERFRRVKHWAGFPELAIRYGLESIDCASVAELDAVAVSRLPSAYLLRKALLAATHPRSLLRAASRVRNLGQVASLGDRLTESFPDGGKARMLPVEHHLAHIASAFFCSPWDEAMCLTVDGFGDFVSTMLAVGRGTDIDVLGRVHFPHSLGLLYTAVTQLLGFPHYGDEYKVMGLAGYGSPTYASALRKVVPQKSDGTFTLDLRYFTHLRDGVDMTWDDGSPRLGPVFSRHLAELLGGARHPEEPITERHHDIACSLQQVYEERLFALVRSLQKRTKLDRLCLAGGCGMNSLANGRLTGNTDVREVYVQPAAGDAGTALGAALYAQHVMLGAPRSFHMDHASWGPEFTDADIRRALAEAVPELGGNDGATDTLTVRTASSDDELAQSTAARIAEGAVVGWFQGRSEWGPRALGHRSILADPRRSDMQEILNAKIKRRESFRPFAPSILEERVADWFETGAPEPFMAKVYPFREARRAEVPAVVHVDGTGRLQTVSRSTNPLYWQLIEAFEQQSGVPMVLNTSFNENEPIVNEPAEALDCFLRTKMDRLVLGRLVIDRKPAP